MNPIRIVIADDEEIVRFGIRVLLRHYPDMMVVGEAATSEQLIKQVKQHSPDISLVETRLSGISVIDACHEIIRTSPNTHIIIFTSLFEEKLYLATLKTGVSAYVSKGTRSAKLIQILLLVAHEASTFSNPIIDTSFIAKHETKSQILGELSTNETQILPLLTEGLTNFQIGQRIGLSEGTVRNYICSILKKLHLVNRAEAAAFAARYQIAARSLNISG